MRALIALLLISGCMRDETVSAYGAADVTWRLQELNGTAVSAPMTLEFLEGGALRGDAPCNQFNGLNTAPYPWFEVTQLILTERACPNLGAEVEFLSALQSMQQSEIAGATLILRHEDGREMVFSAGD
ncbi:META domain-containing protein [Tritonibacter aquimaris]|nr:META domain-containing protein [Tritonibacter aquimaris]